jgi:hypothetical protein
MGARHAILLGLLGAGCVPIPHVEHDSPELEGQLLRDGSPAADVRVLLVTKGDCRGKAQAETRTDPLGRFFLKRTSHWEFLMTLGERFPSWFLCFEYPDGAQAHWWGQRTGSPPERENIRCDLQPGDPRLGEIDPRRSTSATHSHGCLVN